ncbi:endolytic transglycosylase MltG [Lutibacter sp.]|uniref:endolytic transglycosylase MltG n=1 Tax=Lutibacter sp. TaxID=1925666 RepID=UPI0027350D5D|nr:endolytic transglycosylase MltG [Lutibacter sp.]MDP3312977.1 endolytic transglycosylase MltG [Lutibacter sp.]
MSKKKYILLLVVGIICLVGALGGFKFYKMLFNSNVKTETFLYIPTNSNFEQVFDSIKPHLSKPDSFLYVSKLKGYDTNIKSGKYLIEEGASSYQIVNLLISGKQTPVKLSFNNQDTFEFLAGRISKQIEADSVSLLKSFKDSKFLTENGFTSENAIGMYIPNTYEFYWNTNSESFKNKMLTEFKRFWNEERKTKAKKINLTINEVITLASIVQKETSAVSERPMVAKLYLNRIGDGWPLQADPTVIFALKKKIGSHSIIKRVLYNDLKIDSPYNTYKNTGLPPGPIGMPDISSIEAVLNPANHSYFYMCASIQEIGRHEFANTLREHNVNALKYQKWLSNQGISR